MLAGIMFWQVCDHMTSAGLSTPLYSAKAFQLCLVKSFRDDSSSGSWPVEARGVHRAKPTAVVIHVPYSHQRMISPPYAQSPSALHELFLHLQISSATAAAAAAAVVQAGTDHKSSGRRPLPPHFRPYPHFIATQYHHSTWAVLKTTLNGRPSERRLRGRQMRKKTSSTQDPGVQRRAISHQRMWEPLRD